MEMLKKLAERDGDYSILPEETTITIEMYRFWEAFWDLRNKYSIDTGMGGQIYESIHALEIFKYCNFCNIDDFSEKRRYVRFLTAMDRVFFRVKFGNSQEDKE